MQSLLPGVSHCFLEQCFAGWPFWWWACPYGVPCTLHWHGRSLSSRLMRSSRWNGRHILARGGFVSMWKVIDCVEALEVGCVMGCSGMLWILLCAFWCAVLHCLWTSSGQSKIFTGMGVLEQQDGAIVGVFWPLPSSLSSSPFWPLPMSLSLAATVDMIEWAWLVPSRCLSCSLQGHLCY